MAMTDAEIDAMEACLELDHAVAVSSGFSPLHTAGGRFVQVYSGKFPTLIAPSRDWNGAMLCAERFGLFGSHARLLIQTGDNRAWVVYSRMRHDAPTGDEASDLLTLSLPLAIAKSGPLAICRAILKLANQKEQA